MMLLTKFVELLNSAWKSESASNTEISLAIRAFGQLAETIKIFKGNDALPKLVGKLITISKRFFTETGVENTSFSGKKTAGYHLFFLLYRVFCFFDCVLFFFLQTFCFGCTISLLVGCFFFVCCFFVCLCV